MTEAQELLVEYLSSGFRPDPDLTISEWADRYRYLPSRGAAEPGRWRTSRTPYLREIMDALSPIMGYSRVVFMKGSQLGGTECGNNLIGFHIHQAPAPILMVQPSLMDAKKVSQQRIAPMIESTPVLAERVSDPKSRDSGNTILMKLFRGGLLLMTGANSDKGLRSTPAQILFADEVDSYPEDVAGQGDPVALAEKRCSTFPNRKSFIVSSPTIAGLSRIEREYALSDQRKYHVPCPHCGHMQTLKWSGITWDQDATGKHLPETVRYTCESCGRGIDEWGNKTDMLDRGEWRPANPDSHIAGFHLNALYSPIGWKSWRELVTEFLEAKQDKSKLKTFVNTVLGESWEDEVSKFDENELMARREDYEGVVPMLAGVLTCGVDIQDDRIECELVAWGRGQESWSILWETFYGNPAEGAVWQLLDDFLQGRFVHASGAPLPIAAACIDSGGHHTQEVYRFCRHKSKRRILAIKGQATPGRPLTTRPTRSNTGKVPLSLIGTDTAKDAIYARLKIDEPGPGYCHFSLLHTEEYFKQLTAEVVETTYHKGHAKRRYVKAKHQRNEVLDCRVYALAALDLLKADLDKCVDRLLTYKGPVAKAIVRKEEAKSPFEPVQAAATKKIHLTSKRRPRPFRSGWMGGF